MLPAHSKEIVCFRVPTDVFLSCNLIKHQDHVKDLRFNMAMNHIEHSVKHCIHICLDFLYRWRLVQRDDWGNS